MSIADVLNQANLPVLGTRAVGWIEKPTTPDRPPPRSGIAHLSARRLTAMVAAGKHLPRSTVPPQSDRQKAKLKVWTADGGKAPGGVSRPCDLRVHPDCTGIGVHRHHRKTAARGGKWEPANKDWACEFCHDVAHGPEADRLGLILHSWDADPTGPSNDVAVLWTPRLGVTA